MRSHIYEGNEVTAQAGRRKLVDIISEYEDRLSYIEESHAAFTAAQDALKNATCIQGTWGNDRLDVGRVSIKDMQRMLLKSAWRFTYKEYNLEYLATPNQKSQISMMLEAPPEFTHDNVFEWFGQMASNPRESILRGLAEVFSMLDPAFKSHEKMKVGVKGLPKRVILSTIAGYHSNGRDRLLAIVNAIASVQGRPLASYGEVSDLLDDGESLKASRGIWLKTFANGNGHLFFAKDVLTDINRGLAEFYGDVLPDCPDESPTKKHASTEVSKDLQYYPTPQDAVDRVIGNTMNMRGKKVLEPSCGCGRFLEAIQNEGGIPYGIEYDLGRVNEAKSKGFSVLRANFLEVAPKPDFDMVVMNPPFYGRHYALHVKHAMRFLKPGGILYAILPVTARYDHGELDDLRPRWVDLPVGSFRESGTNINTTLATISLRKNLLTRLA